MVHPAFHYWLLGVACALVMVFVTAEGAAAVSAAVDVSNATAKKSSNSTLGLTSNGCNCNNFDAVGGARIICYDHYKSVSMGNVYDRYNWWIQWYNYDSHGYRVAAKHCGCNGKYQECTNEPLPSQDWWWHTFASKNGYTVNCWGRHDTTVADIEGTYEYDFVLGNKCYHGY